MRHPHYTIEEMLDMIDRPNQLACKAILSNNRELFQTVPGSTNNHQAWPGGYIDHVCEIMNIAIVLYREFNGIRPLSFSLSDLLLVVFLHDIEKPWKYVLNAESKLEHRPGMQTKEDHQKFRIAKLKEYGIKLTPEQENGMKYAEGELNDYTNQHRVMGELAAMAHACDVLSARLWHNHPLEKNDPWLGADRTRE
jgi:hypothetical protein